MFSAEENASKVALVAMEERLRLSGFELFDVQFLTPHLVSMGAVEIPRREYLVRLHAACAKNVSLAVTGGLAPAGPLTE